MLFINATERTVGLVLFIASTAVMLALGLLRYHELDEVKTSMRRNLTERRLRAANHIRIRRALSQATDFGQLFMAVQELFDLGEFILAIVELGWDDNSAWGERFVVTERRIQWPSGVEVRDGFICWSWERGDMESSEIIGSAHFWTLRLPLSTVRGRWGYIKLYREYESDALLLDINYLCHLFQRDMSNAAERLLGAGRQELCESQLSMKQAAGD